jgi:prefoldin subunit 5
MSSDEIQQKITEYSTFVSTILTPQVGHAEAASKDTQKDIREYQELQKQLQEMLEDKSNAREELVDLGYKTVSCRAVVEDPSTIFVHVGMGFHAEFQIPEAIAFVEKRIEFLKKQRLASREKKTKEATFHLESAMTILQELEREMQRTGKKNYNQ